MSLARRVSFGKRIADRVVPGLQSLETRLGAAQGARWFSSSGTKTDLAGNVQVPRQMSGPQRDMIKKISDESWSAQQRMMTDRIFYTDIARSENEIRQDLKIAHRLMAKFGFDDLVWNHISSRCLDDQTEDCCDLPTDSYLITPGGMHFSEIRSEDFVFDSVDESGNVIHSGIYRARPDVRCIIHCHTPAITAVSALECGFLFLSQDSAPFYGRLGYHSYEGLHTSDEEGARIAENLGPNGIALMMRNHGCTVVGRSIQEAWVRLYYLDKCCRLQLDCMSTGAKLLECSDELLDHAQKEMERFFPHGKYEWAALKRLVDR